MSSLHVWERPPPSSSLFFSSPGQSPLKRRPNSPPSPYHPAHLPFPLSETSTKHPKPTHGSNSTPGPKPTAPSSTSTWPASTSSSSPPTKQPTTSSPDKVPPSRTDLTLSSRTSWPSRECTCSSDHTTNASNSTKKLESPVLGERAAKAYVKIQYLESKQLLLDLLRGGGKPINPHDEIERMTASVIYTLFYGQRVREANDAILLQAHAVNHEFDQLAQAGKYLVDSFPVLNRLPGFLAPWKAEAAEHWGKQRALHVGILERGLHGRSWNVARQMKRAVDGMGEVVMSVDELALDIGIMADAALDASTETIMWFVLACVTEGHRGWVDKAQGDLDRVVGRGRLPAFDDRAGLPYVTAAVNELMRWRPAGAAGVPHFTKVESSYEGWRIPANSVVIPNHWAITREEAVFGPDVEAFVPEPWLGEELPIVGFGYGRRICPGRLCCAEWLVDSGRTAVVGF
ncbi:hypothetical protein QC761_401100 [Podospora bellae-mahoneyi]|uniref:Cytochrome P450 E-class, group I n=1 Tax=Podospora bellae-mahoneyi TaxID=2093777 RepID=A0ABR0FFT9_9PEZI|nr:hypothetical protein QC761_401100 [Podospora bellae-mahoneyi]